MVKLKYDVELSEWEVVKSGELVEVLDIDYNGFVTVRHKGMEFYLNNEYLEIPSLVGNY